MAALTRRLRAWDGLALSVQEWGAQALHEGAATPLLCLPGLVRTAEDFADFALTQPQRRVISLDYPGRGRSGRAANVARYLPEECLRDVLDVCAALHLHRAVVVGTSFGGLLAMGIAALRPGLLAGVVMNDIGPEVGAAGGAFLRGFVGEDPALPSLAASAAHLRAKLPYLSLTTDEQWLRFAALTYIEGPDRRWHPHWDTRIERLLTPPIRDLWPLFGALEGVRLLLVRGLHSNMLLAPTVARMQALRPDMLVAEVPAVGHAPTLAEPPAARAIAAFLERL
jgi:pimeloyl-ACP methyl ester carboxylesterase